jgi:ribose 5-phosphate isomerase RpiB
MAKGADMNVAVVNEVSAVERNGAIIAALEGRGLSVINAGMTKKEDEPQLLYTHTGLISAILIHLEVVDLVIGGCGTGQGYLNSVLQYPGMMCGHLLSPLDAWLFGRINAGNCVALALNQGFGWAGEMNLRFIFDRLFEVEWGSGYPEQRREPQRESREDLGKISEAAHKPFADIIAGLPENILLPAARFIVERGVIDLDSPGKREIKESIGKRLAAGR